MFFWFIGLAFVGVVLVFRSPALDYRMVILGSIVPLGDLVTGVVGVPPVLHTLLAPVVVMTGVMLLTRNRRLLRRRLLGIPIGMFMHLALDGTWSTTELFWWPAFGLDFADVALPTLGRGLVGLVMELIGVAVVVWSWRRFGLDDPGRREEFVRHGRLDRALVG
jgi:hypothetical protein